MTQRRIVLAAIAVAVFGLGWWVGRGGAADRLYGNLSLFIEVLQRVEESYVDPVEPRQLVDGALHGMLRDLDPYSQFLDERALENLETVTHGSFGGIGIVVSVRDHFPTVISPIEGTPAWEAGLSSGDVIVEIDHKSSFDLSVETVAEMLRGPEGTQVTVTLRREGDAEDRIVTLTRRIIETKSVPYAFVVDDHIGYLRLANFSEKAGDEAREAIGDLRREGARALVLDLRMNPGGLLDQAVSVAEQLLPKNSLIVYTDGRVKEQSNRYYATAGRPELRWPVVVLVDRGSASASEIVAGSVQDSDRGLVLGEQTFGKGSVQSVFPLAGRRAALKLTTALYYTPSGRSIHRARNGVEDVLAFHDDEEDDGAGPATDSEPDSAAAQPAYRTASGRTVYGGGGITPDVEVKQASLPEIVLQVERAGLPFRFANLWVNTHDGWTVERPFTADQWSEFVGYAVGEDASLNRGSLLEHRTLLERSLRRELARRLGGDAAAARVALEGDAVAQRAFEVLRRAKKPDDVFAVTETGPGPGPERTAAR